jgi:hypothetical protein
MRLWLLLMMLGAMVFMITGCPPKTPEPTRDEEDVTEEEDEGASLPFQQVAMIDWFA